MTDIDLHPDEPEPVEDLDLLTNSQRREFYAQLARAADVEANGAHNDDGSALRDGAMQIVDDRGGNGRRTLSAVQMQTGFDPESHEEGDFEDHSESEALAEIAAPDALADGDTREYKRLIADARHRVDDPATASALRGEAADLLDDADVDADALSTDLRGELAGRGNGSITLRAHPSMNPESAAGKLEEAGFNVDVGSAHAEAEEEFLIEADSDEAAREAAEVIQAQIKGADAIAEADVEEGDGEVHSAEEPDSLGGDADALADDPNGVRVTAAGLEGTRDVVGILDDRGFNAELEFGSHGADAQLVVEANDDETAAEAASALSEQTVVEAEGQPTL